MFNLFQMFKTKKSSVQLGTVLVVDDNEVDRTLVQRILQKNNCTVLTAVDGESGIKLANAEKIDLILLDYHLPGLNGIEVCTILKKDPRTRNIPIIFQSLSDVGGDIIDFYEVGAEIYLHKPIDSKILVNEVKLVLEELKTKKYDE